MYYRLIKPLWARKKLGKDLNPHFIKKIEGPSVEEGIFKSDYLKKKNEAGYNVYFFPNHPKESPYNKEKKFLSGKDILQFNRVFVDMDLKDKIYETKEEFITELTAFPVQPTIVVDSGNGVHAYWEIEDLTREDYIFTQMRLIERFKTDESVWTVLQLMRVPGSINTKNFEAFKQAEILEEDSSGKTYKLEELLEYLPEASEERQKKAELHLMKLDGRIELDFDVADMEDLPQRFVDEMKKNKQFKDLFLNPKESYGDRSGADMKLCNILFNKDYTKKEALAVISNTQKALEKGMYRMDYALNTVDKAYVDRVENHFKTVGQKLKMGVRKRVGDPVRGPFYFDCLGNPWVKKRLLGLLAGPGVGKTTVALNIFKHMIENSPDNDDVFVFFSLEMPEAEIIERWVNLVGEESELVDRLYVIANEDDEGEPRLINLQKIYWYCKDIIKSTGKKVASVAIDHIGILNNTIDITRKPTFEAEGEMNGGRGNIRALSMGRICTQVKVLAKMLDTFFIVLTQTTKEKGQGDIPIDKDGAYGAAQYEWIMDYIITVWQPLMRVQNETDLRVLGWRYVKIREVHKDDKVMHYENKLLFYELGSGNLRALTGNELAEFTNMDEKARIARKNAEKRVADSYTNSPSLKNLNKLLKKT